MKRYLRYVPVVLWMGVIFRMSALPGSRIPGRFSVVGHLVEYTVLGALLAWSLRDRLSLRDALAFAVVIASLYGITDEFHQLFVPGRMADPADWAVDTIGAVLGAAVLLTTVDAFEHRADARDS